jgi:hypothetical protein
MLHNVINTQYRAPSTGVLRWFNAVIGLCAGAFAADAKAPMFSLDGITDLQINAAPLEHARMSAGKMHRS